MDPNTSSWGSTSRRPNAQENSEKFNSQKYYKLKRSNSQNFNKNEKDAAKQKKKYYTGQERI